MPPRSAKMKRRIFGFQRRVWWPKWTPASSSSRMETAPVETAMGKLLPIRLSCRAGGSRGAPLATRDHNARPKGAQQANLLIAHLVGHDKDRFIAFECCCNRQTNARVA